MRRSFALVAACTFIAASVGCSEAPERLNAPPQGITENPSPLQDSFTYMVDNAMLEDLSLADIHFVPHSTELNGLGARRLERYAKLLTVYGGAIRYSTDLTDKTMVERRMESIRRYLATTSIAPERVNVIQGMPGGRGMDAREAMAGKEESISGAPDAKAKSGGKDSLMSSLGGLLGGGK